MTRFKNAPGFGCARSDSHTISVSMLQTHLQQIVGFNILYDFAQFIYFDTLKENVLNTTKALR